ncbi:MAG: C-terminal binding protein [Thermodesulfobacteriota bacterium]
MRIGITDYVTPPFDIEQEALGEAADFVFLNSENEADFDPDVLGTLDALLVWHAAIGPKTAQALRRCRIVVRYGVGYDAIDVAALTAAGIPFCNTPDYGTEEVADTAAGMILALQRKILSYDLACRSFVSGWQEHVQPPLPRLSRLTLGVVGVGRTGTALMQRMRPFGLRLMGYDPHQPSGHEKAVGYHRARSLGELLAEADIVSVHCPLSPETKGIIDAEFLARMKPGSILINTARGGLIQSLDAIHDALESGHLLGTGLDVLPEEPPTPGLLIDAWLANDPRFAGRVIINPHTAYFSDHAWREMRYKAAETVQMFLGEGTLRNHIVC